MLQFHVTCDVLKKKKVLSLQEEGLSLAVLRQEIISSFQIGTRDFTLQIYNDEWSDWVNLEEVLPVNKSKLQVVLAAPEERPLSLYFF